MLAAGPRPDYAEVSDALDMPVGSIGPTRARCLKKLLQLLEE
jgi:DNA-directed RNA polymerase specialized sigma24 family protein